MPRRINERRLRRLDALLLSQATEGLSASEARELDALLADNPTVDASGYERAAAAVCLAVHGRVKEPLPAHLIDRLTRRASERHTDEDG